MHGYVGNIEEETLTNTDFRRVLYTTKHSQLVVMSIGATEEIGEEVHKVDQFFRIEAGLGKVLINGTEHMVQDGSAIVVPAGAKHNVINMGTEALKLYTLYSPPNHKDGTVHATKDEAEADEPNDHWDGSVSE